MRTLDDKTTGLTWYAPQKKHDNAGSMWINRVDNETTIKLNKELDSWKSVNLSEFITGKGELLGKLFSSFGFRKNMDQYFAFEDGKLIASMIFSKKEYLYEASLIQKYVEYCEDRKIEGVEGYMTLSNALRALKNNNNHNNCCIDFFAVKPEEQGKGVGTRAIMSINNNLDFFAGNETQNTITTCVSKENIASLRMFTKNGFDELYQGSNKTYQRLNTLYNVR